MRILRALYESRKVWVGAISVVLTALVLKYLCPFLDIPPDQAGIIALAIVSATVAVIGGIAYEDGKKTLSERKPPAALVLLLLPALFIGGCAASATVQQAAAWEQQAWAVYIRNTDRIHDLTLSMYELERTAAKERATAAALKMVEARAVDGKLPVAEFMEGLLALEAERTAVDAQTKAVVGKVRDLITANNAEAAKALRVHGKLAEWLAAGMDETAIPGLVQEAMGLIQSFKAPATVPK